MGDDAPEQAPSGDAATRHVDAADRDDDRDYDRELGVIEAITWVTRSCPNGRVVAIAEGALEAIKTGGAAAMKQQAWIVLSALQGWRGDRARQVHRSLSRYLEESRSS